MDRFRQHNDFFYLCGVEVANAYLLMDGRTRKSTLYLPSFDEHVADQEGVELNSDDTEMAMELTGVDYTKPISALTDDLKSASSIYACHQGAEGRQVCQDSLVAMHRRHQHDVWRTESTPECQFIDLIKQRCGPLDVRDLSPLLCRMRRTKSEREIEVMRKAGEITALATAEAMRSTKAGLLESHLAAVADYVFLANGAAGGGYRPIAASGANIWNLHYYRNDCTLNDGDLVLFDYAPDLFNYTSDIGRMWPVSGTYLAWQRELYSLVVDYHFVLLDIAKPGMTPAEIRIESAARMSQTVARTKWSRPSFGDAVEKLLATSKAVTHTVGMSVHDESGYQEDDVALTPGLVFALDPQLWVPEERLYFRVEDCVVVGEKGLESFTSAVPHQPDDIEKLMQEEGIVQARADLLI